MKIAKRKKLIAEYFEQESIDLKKLRRTAISASGLPTRRTGEELIYDIISFVNYMGFDIKDRPAGWSRSASYKIKIPDTEEIVTLTINSNDERKGSYANKKEDIYVSVRSKPAKEIVGLRRERLEEGLRNDILLPVTIISNKKRTDIDYSPEREIEDEAEKGWKFF